MIFCQEDLWLGNSHFCMFNVILCMEGSEGLSVSFSKVFLTNVPISKLHCTMRAKIIKICFICAFPIHLDVIMSVWEYRDLFGHFG